MQQFVFSDSGGSNSSVTNSAVRSSSISIFQQNLYYVYLCISRKYSCVILQNGLFFISLYVDCFMLLQVLGTICILFALSHQLAPILGLLILFVSISVGKNTLSLHMFIFSMFIRCLNLFFDHISDTCLIQLLSKVGLSMVLRV